MSREWLITQVVMLRAAIREHRDASAPKLCWHDLKLWRLLPEQFSPVVAIPRCLKFMRGCIKYRESLDKKLAGAPEYDHERVSLLEHFGRSKDISARRIAICKAVVLPLLKPKKSA